LANQRSQKAEYLLAGWRCRYLLFLQGSDTRKTGTSCCAVFPQQYNKAMSRLPIVTSQVQILRMEVWVTTGMVVDTGSRQIVGLMDLGEAAPYNNKIRPNTNLPYSVQQRQYRIQFHVGDRSSRNPSQRPTSSIHGIEPGTGF